MSNYRTKERHMRSPYLLPAFVLGVAVALILVALVIAGGTLIFRDRLLALAGVPQTKVIQIDLEEARLVHRTEYAQSSITVHIRGSEPRFFGLIQSERLVIAKGTCRAGTDHDKRSPILERSEATLYVSIGEPEILGCGMDSITFFDGRGFLPASTDLSNKLASEALNTIIQQVKDTDLVARSRENARVQTELFMRRAGFEHVIVSFRP
jgi:hypothetical protein